MKKLIALALALVLTLSMAVCVFAETLNAAGDASADVIGNYSASADAPATVSVGIAWNDVVYTYDEADATWNTETHQSVPGTGGEWKHEGDFSVTVTNDGNVDVTATIGATSQIEGVTAAMSTTEPVALAGWQEGAGDTHAVTSTLTIGGTPAASFANGTVIAKVTVTIE